MTPFGKVMFATVAVTVLILSSSIPATAVDCGALYKPGSAAYYFCRSKQMPQQRQMPQQKASPQQGAVNCNIPHKPGSAAYYFCRARPKARVLVR